MKLQESLGEALLLPAPGRYQSQTQEKTNIENLKDETCNNVSVAKIDMKLAVVVIPVHDGGAIWLGAAAVNHREILW